MVAHRLVASESDPAECHNAQRNFARDFHRSSETRIGTNRLDTFVTSSATIPVKHGHLFDLKILVGRV